MDAAENLPVTHNHSESLLVHFRRIETLKAEAVSYPSLHLNKRQVCDLELLLNRAFYPLRGYLHREDYEHVLDTLRLSDGTVWPMPVCLDVPEPTARALDQGQRLAIRDEEGFLLAVLTVESVWQPDKPREAMAVFGTDDPDRHAGVRILYEQMHPWYVGGVLEGIEPPLHYAFSELRFAPSEVHRRFSRYGWRNVLGFHAEGFLHRAHVEATLRAAREAGASVFIHPAVGLNEPGDPMHYATVRSYQELVKHYPKNMIFLGLLPFATRKAGPREALWQAIIRKNFGCSHFMVANDHADPFAGNSDEERFYPRHAAQQLVREYEADTGIRMIPLRPLVYVEEKADYVFEDSVPSGMRVSHLLPAELQRRLQMDLEVPEWFSFPEVLAEMKRAYPPRSKQGFTVFMTGLSGSGKSTLAKALMVKLMELRDRPVTLLDGDLVRRNLSSELTFTKEHRILNVCRIGFVASEITKNGGIAICAPIAPYEESRKRNRELISQFGGYIEVYVSTPLETCEHRDTKGIYAKARAGLIKGFTGIDDPYEPPSNSEITIDTTETTPMEAVQQVLLHLEEKGFIR